MLAARLSMRKTREILRLRWGEGRSVRETASSCGVGATTVHDVVVRAKQAGLGWPLDDDLDDAALEVRLYPPRTGRPIGRPVPDFAKMYRELKRRGVTLELLWREYREQNPDGGYGYSRFCDQRSAPVGDDLQPETIGERSVTCKPRLISVRSGFRHRYFLEKRLLR